MYEVKEGEEEDDGHTQNLRGSAKDVCIHGGKKLADKSYYFFLLQLECILVF